MSDSFDKVVEALEAQQSEGAYVSPQDRAAAISAHHLFVVLQSGGFSEEQALKIVAHRIAFADSDNPTED